MVIISTCTLKFVFERNIPNTLKKTNFYMGPQTLQCTDTAPFRTLSISLCTY